MNIVQKNIKSILLIFSIVAFVVFFFLSFKLFNTTKFYYLITENENGLKVSDLVYANNLKIGKIKEINELHDGSGKLKLKLSLIGNINIPDKSYAQIIDTEDDQKKIVEIKLVASAGYFDKNDTIPFINGILLPSSANWSKVRKVPEPNEVKGDFKNKPDIPEKNIHEVSFKVQIMISNDKIPLHSSRFKGLKEVNSYTENGLEKYIVGNELVLSEAINLCDSIKKQGFPDAFVVAFNAEKRISVKEALQLLRK